MSPKRHTKYSNAPDNHTNVVQAQIICCCCHHGGSINKLRVREQDAAHVIKQMIVEKCAINWVCDIYMRTWTAGKAKLIWQIWWE